MGAHTQSSVGCWPRQGDLEPVGVPRVARSSEACDGGDDLVEPHLDRRVGGADNGTTCAGQREYRATAIVRIGPPGDPSAIFHAVGPRASKNAATLSCYVVAQSSPVAAARSDQVAQGESADSSLADCSRKGSSAR